MTRTPRSRRKRRREMQRPVAPEIPIELVIEIMTRLPAKSVMRFKCISKFWSCFLGSTYFCNRFLMSPSPPQPQPRLYMSLFDCHNHANSLLLSSVPTTCPTSSVVFEQHLTVQMGGYNLRVVRGFIGLTVVMKALIYNPSTRQLVTLPAVKSNIITEEDGYSINYFICYEPVNDQYKLLCTIAVISDNDMETLRSEFWLFLFEAGGFWKRIAKDLPHHFPDTLDLTMNGVLYYLAWTDSKTCMLVSFDIRSEELSMIQVPRKAGDVLSRLDKWNTHIDYSGKVAVLDYTFLQQNGTVDLWVVEDWSKNEWSNKTLVLEPSQMHLVTDYRLKPKGTALKGKIILVPIMLTSPFYFLCYDFEINDLRRVEIKGIPDRWFNMRRSTIHFDMDFMNSSENIKYLET